VDELQDGILRCVVPAAVAAVVGVVGLTVTAVVSLPAAIALAAGLAITAFVLPLAAKRLADRTARRTAAARAQLADHMVDLLHGAPELEIYGARERKLNEADAVAAELATAERRSGTTVLTAIGMTVQIGTVLAIITLAAPGPVTAALALGALAGMETFLPLTAAAARWASVRPAIDRIKDLLTGPAKPERPSPEVELTLVRGKHIGVVGPSGAGKSTLLAAIARAEPEARGAMADAHIFDATIRENLAFAKPGTTDADLDAVAKLARLDEWLRSLPEGWDTRITGETVSGGQRQRLILARALLADAPILLLDEPVEGLETQQADEILADVLATTSHKAVVLVTHRLSQLSWFDDIVVLDNGKVAQRGSHACLVSQPGYYRDSWEAEQLHQ
jgi:ATP-binding cassette subfamily C protein CydC